MIVSFLFVRIKVLVHQEIQGDCLEIAPQERFSIIFEVGGLLLSAGTPSAGGHAGGKGI
jgi:hypothetical protein